MLQIVVNKKLNFWEEYTPLPQSMQVSNSAIVTTFLGRVVKKKTRYFTARLIVRGQLGVSDLASGLKLFNSKYSIQKIFFQLSFWRRKLLATSGPSRDRRSASGGDQVASRAGKVHRMEPIV